MNDWLDRPPPWKAFPRMGPDELGATQGAQEAWLDGVWRPFWASLNAAQKESYFDRWQASAAWRDAVSFVCDVPVDHDAAEDAADSERYLEARAAGREPPTSLAGRLARLWRRR